MEDQFATFRLVEGSGPVHLSGSHQTETTIVGEDDMDDTMGEDEIDDEDEDEEDVEDVPVSNASSQNGHVSPFLFCFI